MFVLGYSVPEDLEGRALRHIEGKIFRSKDVELFIGSAYRSDIVKSFGIDESNVREGSISEIAMRCADRLLRKWRKDGRIRQGDKRGTWVFQV